MQQLLQSKQLLTGPSPSLNLSLGNLRFDVLVFSISGALLGAPVGVVISPSVPYRLLKTVFSLCVLSIGLISVITSLKSFSVGLYHLSP